MEQAKHTPGPWDFTLAGTSQGGVMVYDEVYVYAPGSGSSIAVAADIVDPLTNEPSEANARLIATAPTLLSIARRWAALDGDAWHVTRHAADKERLMADTLAAIATATNAATLAATCTRCGGTGAVDDGELYCSEGGIPYENGPIKCMKDCPVCHGERTALARQLAP